MFRGSVVPPNADRASSEALKQNIMSKYLEKRKNPPLHLISQYMESLGKSIAHTSLIPHRVMGVSGYARVTSPLRRFSDMIAHWQIEAAIRYEAETGKKYNGAEPNLQRGVLPFTQRHISESIVTLAPREKLIAATQRDVDNHWVNQALSRALHYGEATLPATLRCYVKFVYPAAPTSSGKAMGHIPEFGLRVALRDIDDAQMGDEWEVALDSVDLFNGRVLVKPIRLLSREQTGLDET